MAMVVLSTNTSEQGVLYDVELNKDKSESSNESKAANNGDWDGT